ncbi:hypothetical protein GGTG_01426 [Gaeumannomyces tritici R3-111a-1]|uniref:Uncharacterized protein n=1 Tax=Gaeumannomyces tritici (strain R3-111a-1) TaxID=644352 RepID=J3NJJ5_GAET3|nr:hypothetical protein GGTG_01426 [Gaeumannomyces tritici R3-111a-1]EJT81447.1 hypothetical protein GGTG_01426 [Gaeumannomyces tritici R3-111a-1]
MLQSPVDDKYFATIQGSLVKTWKEVIQGGASHLQSRQILRAHNNDVNGMAFSSSGGLLASTSCDCNAHIWRVEGNYDEEAVTREDQVAAEDASALQKHARAITSLAPPSEAKMVASGNLGGLILLWNADDGTQLLSLDGHSREITSPVFSKDEKILISGSTDETIGVWDTKLGKRIHRLEGHVDWVRCVALCPRDRLVASASDDHTVRQWNLPPQAEQPSHPDDNHDTSRSDAASDQDSMVKLESTMLEGHNDYVYRVAFSSDGRYLASCGDDTWILIWGVENCVGKGDEERQPLPKLQQEGEYVAAYRALAFLPVAKRLVSVSELGDISLRDTKTQQHLWEAPGEVLGEVGRQWHPRVLGINPDDVLLTEFGAWRNRLTNAPPTSSDLPSRYSYSVEGRWTMWNDQKVVFLPNQYAPATAGTCSIAVRGDRVAVGCMSGQVLVLKLPEDEKPPLLFQSERR